MMKSLEEMVEWLRKDISTNEKTLETFQEIERGKGIMAHERISEIIKKTIAMKRAILAALAERTERPSEGERKELLEHFNEFCPGIAYPKGCIKCNKIRALILGNPAPGKVEAAEEKRKE